MVNYKQNTKQNPKQNFLKGWAWTWPQETVILQYVNN
jgi:hypothetical protein